MALWLFLRKSRRKRSRRGAAADDDDDDGSIPGGTALRAPARSQGVDDATRPVTMNGSAGSDRPALGKKQRTESAKQLPRRARAYSFETGRNDSINVSRKRSKKGKHASAPPPPPMRAMTNADLDKEKMLGPLAGHVFPRVLTLHASKRDGQHWMPRKNSSKRRRRDAHDREREAELKAMSNFVPLRPATDSWTAGRPMRKESKRVLTGLGFGGTAWRPWAREIRTSVISLPMAESMDSALSSDSDQISYKISALDAFAPKPTLRYATCPSRFASLRNDGTGPPRTPSLRKKPSEPIPGSSLGAHKRIDELADNLSAGDLRELMERDQRRREQQRQTEQERVERRLARRAEKQRAAEEQARESGQEPPRNLERGVAGREMVGLGIDPTSAIVTSSRRRSSGSSPKQPGRQPAVDDDDEEPDRKGRASPLDSFHRTDSIDLEEPLPAPAKEPEDPVVPPVPQRPKTRTSWGLLRSTKTRTNSPPLSNREQPEVDRLRKGSESSSSKGHKSWTFIFKWNSKSKRASGGPSSFSNTSRDSMATTQPQPAAAPASYVPAKKINAAVPKRTLSRFREDLPETPISPPDSRMQSPDAEPLATIPAEHESPPLGDTVPGMTPVEEAQHPCHEPPTSEMTRETPTSWLHQDASPHPQPMSLASIDSEGSWLSGRINSKRRSNLTQKRESIRSQARHSLQQSSGGSDETGPSHEEEDLAIADDEYLSQFARRPSNATSVWARRKSTGEARPSSDEDEDARWGAVCGKVPTLVEGRLTRERIKSHELLLNTSREEGDSDLGSLESPVSQDLEPEPHVQHAKSVSLGKGHVRNFSAGSAKLLNLTPPSSVDTQRRSVSPQRGSHQPARPE